MKYKTCEECETTYNPDTVDECPACSMTIVDTKKRYPKPEKREYVRIPEYNRVWNMATKRYDVTEI